MDLEVARRVLCERLLAYLAGVDPTLREDIGAALAVEGKLLHQPASDLDGRWALLPFCLACDLRVSTPAAEWRAQDPACDAALAMECVVCATDLFDDVMDDDATPLIEQIGMARVLNVALALVSLAQSMLLAPLDLSPSSLLPVGLLDALQRALLRASAGQQQDLLAERRPACDLTREECIEIAAAKAGSLLALACQVGAMCAGVNDVCIEGCAEAGRLLGIAAQLDNDAHDLSMLLLPSARSQSRKSDLARGKKTLPIVLAAHALRAPHGPVARSIDFRRMDLLSAEEREDVLSALREGILSTWGIALLYRERAREKLTIVIGERAISPALYRVLGLDYVLMDGERK